MRDAVPSAKLLSQDCPLVYVSAEFEAITGYTRQTAVGLNCRFLQPKDHVD